ncbi:hypothetical protein PVAND_015009 [Polypedilum vanderplanki]|uniref:Uncharacterized protein n=1 Tax=Polypedilum vanderplanki TaxID=319348 RepID=A0A9J6BBP0_POLVA|nr:hypothetical protein PVAND_015009 [Polypedilum vanderplanki]
MLILKLTSFLIVSIYLVNSQLDLAIFNKSVILKEDVVTMDEIYASDNRTMTQTYNVYKKIYNVSAYLVARIVRFKMTVVNETLQVCTKRTSKNVLVKYLIDYTLNNIDRDPKCPLYGVYNWTVDTEDDSKYFTFAPPFLKKGASSLVSLSVIVSGKVDGKLMEVARMVKFYRAKIN